MSCYHFNSFCFFSAALTTVTDSGQLKRKSFTVNVVQRDVNIANQTLSLSHCLFPVYSPSLLHIHTSNYFVNILCSQTKNIFEIIFSISSVLSFLFFSLRDTL